MLRRQPEKVILDSITLAPAANPTLVVNADGTVFIAGYSGVITPSASFGCYLECPSACVPQVETVTVVIPASCECPYEWGLYIECKPCPQLYEVQTTFGSKKFYGYQDPSGAVPTAADTAAAVAANINADPFACVTATVVGAVITLTEKDCNKSCGFSAYIADGSGTVANVTPHTAAVLSAEDLARIFPIQPGFFGARPSIAYCEQYCLFHIVSRGQDQQDVDMSNNYNKYEQELYLFINQNDPNYAAFAALLAATFPCIP